MLKRLVTSAVLSFVLGMAWLLFVPATARLVEPLVCAGTLEPETRQAGLAFRCVSRADGRISSVPGLRVVLATVPLLTVMLLFPIYAGLSEAERRARTAQGTISADLAVAVRARAEILRIVRHASFTRPLLSSATKLKLVLWVQPPEGRPYEATVSWLVEDESLLRLTVGSLVTVRINPRCPERVYPDQPWAHYAWRH